MSFLLLLSVVSMEILTQFISVGPTSPTVFSDPFSRSRRLKRSDRTTKPQFLTFADWIPAFLTMLQRDMRMNVSSCAFPRLHPRKPRRKRLQMLNCWVSVCSGNARQTQRRTFVERNQRVQRAKYLPELTLGHDVQLQHGLVVNLAARTERHEEN